MAEFPALPLWTDAYLGDTAHLTNEEHGVYLRLLMFAWRSPDCCLPDDDKRLAIMTGMSDKKWRAVRPVIAAFWIIENGAWTQKRLTKERDFVRGKSEKNRDAAKARWTGKPLGTNDTGHADAMPTHMPNGCQPDAPTPTPIDSIEIGKPISCPFSQFWAEWPSKVAKQAAEKAWKKLGAADRQDALDMIGPWFSWWRERNPTASPIHASTYLNQKRFKDDTSQRSLPAVRQSHQREAEHSRLSNIIAIAARGTT